MTNFEKYKDDLIEIDGEFAFNKNTEKIVECGKGIYCEDCIFNERGCFESDRIKWLCEEYKNPILSDDELELIKTLSNITGINYKYVAFEIDTCGVIGFFEIKPRVNKLGNYYSEYGCTYVDIVSKDKVLPNITHKDGLYDIENKTFTILPR